MTRQIVFALDVRANGHLWLSREQVREKEAKQAKKARAVCGGRAQLFSKMSYNSVTVTADLWHLGTSLTHKQTCKCQGQGLCALSSSSTISINSCLPAVICASPLAVVTLFSSAGLGFTRANEQLDNSERGEHH